MIAMFVHKFFKDKLIPLTVSLLGFFPVVAIGTPALVVEVDSYIEQEK